MEYLNFCSGLPRTGSTVLMNILQQNPNIFTTSTDPYPQILNDQILIKSRYTEAFQAMSCAQADNAVYGMALGATRGWYEGLTSKPVVISKARQWANLRHLFPSAKTLVCVRDLRDIVESFDRVNANIKALHTITESNTLYASLSESEKFSYHFKELNAFSSALYQELPKYTELFKKDRSRVKFIRYEDLLRDPEYMLNRIYEFLNLDRYDHDLQNIAQSSMFEHDNAYFREKTSHTVKPTISSWKDPERLLSDSFHKKVVDEHYDFYNAFYPEVIA